MARKIKTEKVKKKNKKKVIIIVILFVILVGGLSFFLYKRFAGGTKGPQTVVKVINSLDEYGYSLTDQDSSYYKGEFEELKKILNADSVDEKAYTSQVAKMFVIDLYTMSTKINKYDIGGYEFYFKDKNEQYSQKVMDTIYGQLEDNTYGDRKQELPVVKGVEVLSNEESQYDMNDGTVAAHQVKVKITYEKDLGYDTEGTLMICKEDGLRWSIVDYQPTLEPKYEVKKGKN